MAWAAAFDAAQLPPGYAPCTAAGDTAETVPGAFLHYRGVVLRGRGATRGAHEVTFAWPRGLGGAQHYVGLVEGPPSGCVYYSPNVWSVQVSAAEGGGRPRAGTCASRAGRRGGGNGGSTGRRRPARGSRVRRVGTGAARAA